MTQFHIFGILIIPIKWDFAQIRVQHQKFGDQVSDRDENLRYFMAFIKNSAEIAQTEDQANSRTLTLKKF